ncbi:MAG: FAD-dependent oxidoreductase [Coriobacteriia bacterium]|nr:FAD-dependent oxidoreductase [Coriobacteriia bacterium]
MSGSTYTVPFHVHIPCAPHTGTFRFGKPDGYTFVPGQYFSLTLQTREGPQTKHFSHADAPGDPHIELTTRLTGSAFKDALLALKPHDDVTFTGPRGRLTVPDGVGRVGFLVGGVGITPARSIIRDAVGRSSGLDVLLFYGNLDQSCIPFKLEFDAVAADVPGIRVVHVLQVPLPGWEGERGFITADVVRNHTDPCDGRHWFVSGPPQMVEAMKRVAAQLGLPDDVMHIESFAGYAPA